MINRIERVFVENDCSIFKKSLTPLMRSEPLPTFYIANKILLSVSQENYTLVTPIILTRERQTATDLIRNDYEITAP